MHSPAFADRSYALQLRNGLAQRVLPKAISMNEGEKTFALSRQAWAWKCKNAKNDGFKVEQKESY
jgi:hypothetical protein